jgi:DNA-3-methyladenine glycosylase I
VVALRESHGSFARWLDAHHPASLEEWTSLFRETFRFTGGEIVREFLLSTGYLPGAHHRRCPIYSVVSRRNPPWMKAPRQKSGREKRRGIGYLTGP